MNGKPLGIIPQRKWLNRVLISQQKPTSATRIFKSTITNVNLAFIMSFVQKQRSVPHVVFEALKIPPVSEILIEWDSFKFILRQIKQLKSYAQSPSYKKQLQKDKGGFSLIKVCCNGTKSLLNSFLIQILKRMHLKLKGAQYTMHFYIIFEES